jgi:hypothetical protein
MGYKEFRARSLDVLFFSRPFALDEPSQTWEHLTDPFRNRSGEDAMEIDKSRIQTQEETNEEAPMDKANDRVEAEMKRLESQAKERVAQGLDDEELERNTKRTLEEDETNKGNN